MQWPKYGRGFFDQRHMEGDHIAILPERTSWEANPSAHLLAHEAFVSHIRILGQGRVSTLRAQALFRN
jgi:hypothetical protein